MQQGLLPQEICHLMILRLQRMQIMFIIFLVNLMEEFDQV